MTNYDVFVKVFGKSKAKQLRKRIPEVKLSREEAELIAAEFSEHPEEAFRKLMLVDASRACKATPEDRQRTKRLLMALHIDNGRRCGHCTVCCTHTEIAELNKPMGYDCVHLSPCGQSGGCSIY